MSQNNRSSATMVSARNVIASSIWCRVSPIGSRNRKMFAYEATVERVAAAVNSSPNGAPPKPAETLAPTIAIRLVGNAKSGGFDGGGVTGGRRGDELAFRHDVPSRAVSHNARTLSPAN